MVGHGAARLTTHFVESFLWCEGQRLLAVAAAIGILFAAALIAGTCPPESIADRSSDGFAQRIIHQPPECAGGAAKESMRIGVFLFQAGSHLRYNLSEELTALFFGLGIAEDVSHLLRRLREFQLDFLDDSPRPLGLM